MLWGQHRIWGIEAKRGTQGGPPASGSVPLGWSSCYFLRSGKQRREEHWGRRNEEFSFVNLKFEALIRFPNVSVIYVSESDEFGVWRGRSGAYVTRICHVI